ncbi:DUF2255 family protein [Salinifilum aidingensis]
MTTWDPDEFTRIAHADEVEIAPQNSDGSAREPVPIWVVPHGDDLYVRSYRGQDGAWFRAAHASGKAHIRAGGVAAEVAVAEVTDDGINDAIDEAYRSKYRAHLDTYVPPMLTPQARGTTLKLLPR